jgi:MFS family permease
MKPEGQRRALILLAVAQFLGMSVWFSASAAVPALRSEWNLNPAQITWLTLAVQLGFVAGTLFSAAINLADIISVRLFFACSAIGAGLANACIGLLAWDAPSAITMRFATGFFLAGVYPPGMKLMASWYRESRGMAMGVLIGALTIGKALPYLVRGIGSDSWRQNEMAVSAAALAGGLIVWFLVAEGPFAAPLARFDFRQVKQVFVDRGLRLANFGYFGHMWELYAMWTWTPVMLRSSLAATGTSPRLAEFASFLVIGAGAVGCVAAGVAADRVGRTSVTSAAMIISSACCMCIGMLYGSHPALLISLAAIWGVAAVADSAQFSACATELADPRYIGTALTMQKSVGYLVTMLSVQWTPALESLVGWQYAFMALAPGPILGTIAMLRLRGLPQAVKIAGGRR